MTKQFTLILVLSLMLCAEASAQRTTAPKAKTGVNPRTAGAEPARYPLELVSPREAGTSPSMDDGSASIPAGHRIFKAYPGIEYNIRAVVLGGSFPYAYTLSNAPAGMTIHPKTGEIRWLTPRGNSVKATITVSDSEGTTRTSTWNIDVTTSGFRFLDANRGDDSNAGTIDKPWKTLGKVKSSGAAGEIVYFRSGTYKTTDMMASGNEGHWRRVEFSGRAQPVQWIAFPQEKPVIDNDYSKGGDKGRFIRLTGGDSNPIYLDGLEITNSWHIGLQFGSGLGDFAVFRRLGIHDIAEGIDGANSAGIMTLTSPTDPSWYTVFQDNDFHHNAPGGIKQYSQKKLLWEDCQFRDSGTGPDLKSDVSRFEVRTCAFYNNRGNYPGLFGNLHPARGGDISGEIRFNRMLCGDSPDMLAMDVNQDGLANVIHLYRNTFVGTVRVRNTDQADGPFHFTRNVIVNSSAGRDQIVLEAVSDASRIHYLENLCGRPSDRLVDADGNLVGKYRSQVGSRGHQIIDQP